MSYNIMLKLHVAFVLVLVHCISAQEVYSNPVRNSNHPDPGVLTLADGQGFVAVTTSNYISNDEGPAFPILFSADLINWEERGHVFPVGAWPEWAFTDLWAPEIHLVNGSYYVYFSARKVADNQLAIGVAVSITDEGESSPFGPFYDYGQPIIEDDRGVIDIHFFRDPNDDITYLSWKTDDNAVGQASSIYLRQVHEDGIHFVEDAETFTLISATEPDDANVVEGQWIFYRQPFYYLIFSSNGFMSPYYHVTAARSSQVSGPFERFEGEEFLHTDLDRYENGENCTFVGPGHGSVVHLENSDEWWYVYHTWRYDQVGAADPGRVLNVDRINWQSNWPSVGIPSDYPTEKPNTDAQQ